MEVLEMSVRRKRVTCGIATLPSEILDFIFEPLFEDIGIRKATRLRLVNKLFYNTINHCVIESYLYKKRGAVALWLDAMVKRESVPASIKKLLIFARLTLNSEDQLLAPIRKAIQVLEQNNPSNGTDLDTGMIKICETLADYLVVNTDRGLSLGWKIQSQKKIPWSGWCSQANNPKLVERQTMESECILGAAIIMGNTEFVRTIVTGEFFSESGTLDVNIENPYFGRPIHLAARWGQLDICNVLLEHGVDTQVVQESLPYIGSLNFCRTHNSYPNLFGSPLQVACAAGHIDIVRALLNEKPTLGINLQDSARAAARYGNSKLLRLIIDKVGLDSIAPKGRCGMLLLEGCAYGRKSVVKLMTDYGESIKVKLRYSINGGLKYWNGLQLAAYYGHVGVLRFLLENGADRAFVHNPLQTDGALVLAIKGGHLECIRILLECGVELRSYHVTHSLIRSAMLEYQIPTMKFLFSVGVPLKTWDKERHTYLGEQILFDAIQFRILPAVDLMLKEGYFPNHLSIESFKEDCGGCPPTETFAYALLEIFRMADIQEEDYWTRLFAGAPRFRRFKAGQYYRTPTWRRYKSSHPVIATPLKWHGRDF